MKMSLITALAIGLALLGQRAQASEAIAAVRRPTNSSDQPALVLPSGTNHGVEQPLTKLAPVEIGRKPLVDGNQTIEATRLQQIAEFVRIDRNFSSEPQRLILIELP